MRFFKNSVGQYKVHDGGEYDQSDEVPAGFIKEVKGEKAEDVSSRFKIIAKSVIQGDKNGKKEDEEAVIE